MSESALSDEELTELLNQDPPPPPAVTAEMALVRAEGELSRSLVDMGLDEREVREWVSAQRFNKLHFAESMNMVTATAAEACLKLKIQFKEVEQRLKGVRNKLAEIGYNSSDKDRLGWVCEEGRLMFQLTELGKLIRDNQEVWMRGSAQLASVMLRTPETDRQLQKPGFGRGT